jgi:hypothetical protein
MMQDKRSFNQNCRAIEGDHSHVTGQSFVPKIKFTSAYTSGNRRRSFACHGPEDARPH